MGITIHNMLQGSDEWHQIRSGMITASNMSLLLTPTLKTAANDKVREYKYELAAQRINDFTEDSYQGYEMTRGHIEEDRAREIYSDAYANIRECGFVVNNHLGFNIGWSPDGLVGDDGCIEIKSRRQKFQVKTIVFNEVPKEYVLQIQTSLLVSGRKWCDFIQYSNGMPLYVERVIPDLDLQKRIITATKDFEKSVTDTVKSFNENSKGLVPTERHDPITDDALIYDSEKY